MKKSELSMWRKPKSHVKVKKLGLEYLPGWVYYVNSDGDVMKVIEDKQLPKGVANNPVFVCSGISHEEVHEQTEPDHWGSTRAKYHHFMDKDGDISRCPFASEVEPEFKVTPGKLVIQMITKRFEYKDSISDKFWEISYPEDGKSYTATWGKRGTLGTSKTKHKTSMSEIEKKIQEKLNKGYKAKGSIQDKRSKSNPAAEVRDPSPFDIY